VAAVAQAVPGVPLVACGGIAEAPHALAALQAGADAVAMASALHTQPGLLQLKAELSHAGVEVRL
jgi:dihydroorotate dehydrogenase